MKALVLEKPGVLNIHEIPIRRPNIGEALIKIASVSVCGSDISAYRGKGVPVPYPLVLGHEIGGVIKEINDPDSDLKIGDRVILNPYLYCGKCYPCSLGHTNCCESLKVLGVQTNGAMSEYFVHPSHLLHKVPKDLPWELVPIIEPLVIALHGLHTAKIKAGEHIAIIGAGPIGLLAAMTALQYGAIPILIDIIDGRLKLAKSLNIKYTLNPNTDDVVSAIAQITNGRMAEVVLEMSGSHHGIQNALDYASYCGRISFTGWPTGETSLNTSLITKKELNICGSRTGTNEFIEAIELISKEKINAQAILSLVISFDELPSAIANQSKSPDSYLKIVALL